MMSEEEEIRFETKECCEAGHPRVTPMDRVLSSSSTFEISRLLGRMVDVCLVPCSRELERGYAS